MKAPLTLKQISILNVLKETIGARLSGVVQIKGKINA
jgi:hypothetical protein